LKKAGCGKKKLLEKFIKSFVKISLKIIQPSIIHYDLESLKLFLFKSKLILHRIKFKVKILKNFKIDPS